MIQGQSPYDRTWNAAGSCGGQSRAFPVAQLALSGDFSYLTPMNYDFPLLLRFLATNDSVWLGNFLPKWCKDAKHVQAPSANGQRDTSCFCLPLWSMLQIRLHFFFDGWGHDWHSVVVVSVLMWCHTVCETPLFLKSALPISKSFSEIVLCPLLCHFAQRAFCSDDKWQSFAQSGVPFLQGKSVIWEVSEMRFFEHFCLARIKAAVFMGACSLLVQRESVWLSELHHGKLAKSAPDKSCFILLQEIHQQVAIWSLSSQNRDPIELLGWHKSHETVVVPQKQKPKGLPFHPLRCPTTFDS